MSILRIFLIGYNLKNIWRRKNFVLNFVRYDIDTKALDLLKGKYLKYSIANTSP